jgi:hypothetical protein
MNNIRAILAKQAKERRKQSDAVPGGLCNATNSTSGRLTRAQNTGSHFVRATTTCRKRRTSRRLIRLTTPFSSRRRRS